MTAENALDVSVRSKDVERVERQLSSFAKEGLLISETDLRTDLRSRYQNENREIKPVQVTALGIATCNRPEHLQRSATSYLENGTRYGQRVKLVVVDDSIGAEVRRANRNILSQLRNHYDASIVYIDRQQRTRVASRLARQAGVPLEVAEFALLGDPQSGMSYGAPVNTFLLRTAGEVVVLSDDDVICKVAAAPDAVPGLVLTSRENANEYWFFNDHDAALEAVSYIDKDFFGLHEQLLGQPPLRCIGSAMSQGDGLTIDGMSPRFLENLSLPEARVVVSFTGTVGDSGAKDTLSHLFSEGSTFERLAGSAQEYSMKMNTHQVLKTVRRRAISDGMYCMSGVMGLDHRALLPPFAPVGRNEDGVFSLLLKVCFPGAFRGYVPYALVHNRPAHRVATGVRESIKPPRVNDLLMWLILAFDARPRTQDGASQLRRLGQFLTAWGRAPAGDFGDFVRQVCYRNVSFMLQEAERRLDEKRGQPTCWAEDMMAFISAYEELLLQKDFFVPSDLSGRAAERMALFQDLVYKFGQLLIHWPALVEAAKELRNRGEGLGEEVQQALVNNVA